MKDGKNETDRGRPQPWANAQGYMLSPLRGWRIAVQYHFLNRNFSCGDAVISRVEQFSTPKNRSLQNSRFGLPKTNVCSTKLAARAGDSFPRIE